MTSDLVIAGLRYIPLFLLSLFSIFVLKYLRQDYTGPGNAKAFLSGSFPSNTLCRLLVKNGGPGQRPATGTVFTLDGRTMIGRDDDNHIVLLDPYVSSRHALIWRKGDNYCLQDLSSTNGVFLNEKRIGEPVVLKPGDVIRLGGTLLVVERGQESDSLGCKSSRLGPGEK
ncbi:MAG TPA: FHA domain-containing protein [Clostridia bacterium]|nr:FHA domain-containing protein [Clostridia bacterium]